MVHTRWHTYRTGGPLPSKFSVSPLWHIKRALIIEPGGFPWNPGTRAGREGRGPSRITFGGRHQKGVDHFRSVVSGYAAQPRRCSSQLDMLVRDCLRRDILYENNATSSTGRVSSHVARIIAAQLNWTLESDSPVGAFPVLTGSLMGKLRKGERACLLSQYLLLVIGWSFQKLFCHLQSCFRVAS